MIYEFQSLRAASLAAKVQAFLKGEEQRISRGGIDDAPWIWKLETDIDPLIAMFILEVYVEPPLPGRPAWWEEASEDFDYRTQGLLKTADPHGADLRLLDRLEKQADDVPYGLDKDGLPQRLQHTRSQQRRILEAEEEERHQQMLSDPVYQEDKQNQDRHDELYADDFDTEEYWAGSWSNTTKPDRDE